MKKAYGNVAAALALALLCAPAAAADIYIEKVNKTIGQTGGENPGEWITRMWVDENHIRIEEPEGGAVSITDFNERALITLDTNNKEYFIIPLEQVQQDFIRSTALLKNRIEMNWRVEAPQDGGEIAGYRTQLIRFHGAGAIRSANRTSELQITMSIWVSTETPAAAQVTDRMLEVMGLDKNPFVGPEVLAELKRIGGFHLKAVIERTMDGKTEGVEQTVLLLETVEPEAGRYGVPPTYREAAAPTTP